MEHLVDCYQGEGMLSLNKNAVKIGVKDAALISGLSVVNLDLKLNAFEGPIFKDRFFSNVKQVSYQEINQLVFGNRFIKRVRTGDKGEYIRH